MANIWLKRQWSTLNWEHYGQLIFPLNCRKDKTGAEDKSLFSLIIFSHIDKSWIYKNWHKVISEEQIKIVVALKIGTKIRFKCYVKQVDKLSYRWFIAEHWIYRSFISPAPYCFTVLTPTKPSISPRDHRFSPPKSPLLYPPARRAMIHADNGHRSPTISPQFAKNSREQWRTASQDRKLAGGHIVEYWLCFQDDQMQSLKHDQNTKKS